MVTTIGTAIGEIEDELECMLDMVAEAIDRLDDNKPEEAVSVLIDLEDRLLTFLDYEEVDDEDAEPEVVEEKPKASPKQSAKAPAKTSSSKPAKSCGCKSNSKSGCKSNSKSGSKPKSSKPAEKPKSKKTK